MGENKPSKKYLSYVKKVGAGGLKSLKSDSGSCDTRSVTQTIIQCYIPHLRNPAI